MCSLGRDILNGNCSPDEEGLGVLEVGTERARKVI